MKNDRQRVDNKYTIAIGMSIWRYFNIGKYKHQEVKKICYQYPSYIEWCLENWDGFKLTKSEHWDYLQGLRNKLSRDPNNKELASKVKRQELSYSNNL